MNSPQVRAVTEANLPIEVVSKSVLVQIKTAKPVWVSARCLRASDRLLFSDNYSECQGVSLTNKDFSIGALAHNFPTQDPYYTLTGEWADGDKLEDPKKIFSNLAETLAVHVYHRGGYSWPENWIRGALKKIGIEKLVHVPIKSRIPGRNYWMDIAQDVPKGLVYVFPTDFPYGICLDLRKCFVDRSEK